MATSQISALLASAGLLGLPFTWDSADNILYGDTLTSTQKTDIANVFAADASTSGLLAAAQVDQVNIVTASYTSASHAQESFTNAAGTTAIYQADDKSLIKLQQMITTYAAGTPSGFYWVTADNTQIPFTLVDLQALALLIGGRGWTDFQLLQGKKSAIYAATTIADVQAVVW